MGIFLSGFEIISFNKHVLHHLKGAMKVGGPTSPYWCWDFIASQSFKDLVTSQIGLCASLVFLIWQCGGFPLDDELVVPFKSFPTPSPCASMVTYVDLAFALGLLPFVLAKSTFGSWITPSFTWDNSRNLMGSPLSTK